MGYNIPFLHKIAIELNEIHCALPPIQIVDDEEVMFADIVRVGNTVPPETYDKFSSDVVTFLKKESRYVKDKNKCSGKYAPTVRVVTPIPFF